MCQIEFTTFKVNGSPNIPSCIAKTTDVITIDLGASFISSETGSWVAWIGVSYNNGATQFYSATNNVIVGINNFIVSIPSNIGTINVTEVGINNADATIECGGSVIHNPTITNCQTLTVSAPSIVGSINFVSNPQGAEIFLDNADQQHTAPFLINGIPAGTHTYRLKLTNYTDITGTVVVQANTIAQVSANFRTGLVVLGVLFIGTGIALLSAAIYYVLKKPEGATVVR
jgi:hypothetical protein